MTLEHGKTQGGWMQGIAFRDLSPGDADWILARHAALYAEAEGFDDSFAAAVAQVLERFEADRGPARARAFIPLRDGRPRGSLLCTREDAATARLRLFLLEPEERGRGLGPVCIHLSQSRAETRKTKPMKLVRVFSQRRAMRRKRLIR